MPQLLTQCPFCQTTFRVSDAQMQAARGVVRCGSCMEVFLAAQHRVTLKEKPEPAPGRGQEHGLMADFPREQSRPAGGERFPDSLLEDTEPQWQVLDTPDDPDAATAGEYAIDTHETGHDLFSSWEEEEQFRATEKGVAASYPEAEDVPDGEALPAGAQFTETGEEPEMEPAPAPEQEKPLFAGMLDPSGYSIANFSVDHFLPPLHELETAGGEPGTKDDRREAGIADPDPAELEEGLSHEGEQAPVTPAAKTPVIVPPASRIPTLEPDVVAREEIPAAGIGAQTMAWFQSLRKSVSSRLERQDPDAGGDEKARIRSHLSALRDEDSLEPVASEQLEVLDTEPVELLSEHQRRRKRLQNAALACAGVLLVLGLAGQYAWFNLDSLVRGRHLPQVTGLLCSYRECPDPAGIDLSGLVTEELVVRSHPSAEDALQVDFIFRNDNNREQRFPLVELNFTDNAGDIVANRVFSSAEYLPQEMQLFTHMPAHSSIQVSLELVDPGADATGYALVFRDP